MNKIKSKYEYVYLFINDIEHLYDIKNNIYKIYDNDATDINKNKIFYYVDNGHITGINIPVPTLSHFLVTTIKESLLRDIHQGIYRLRLLGYCQYVTIIQNNYHINDNIYDDNHIDNKKNIKHEKQNKNRIIRDMLMLEDESNKNYVNKCYLIKS